MSSSWIPKQPAAARAEIIEIAFIDTTRREWFQSLCKPENPIPITAMRIHEITDRMVADAKT